MEEYDLLLAHITPRAAAVTLLLLDRVLERYEKERGVAFDESEKNAIIEVLRYIACRDTRKSTAV
jgi:DNA phosphorothioation-dependent restriction protein DptG